MASILDISLLNFLLPVFVFSLTFVLIYSLLNKTEMFGKNNQALNLVAAFSIASISVFTGSITGLISVVTPWIVFMVIMLLMLFGMFKFFGHNNDKEIWDTIGTPTLYFVIILIIILIGLSTVFESQITPYGDNPGGALRQNVLQTLTHPRLLGALFILIIASFAVRFLSEGPVTK